MKNIVYTTSISDKTVKAYKDYADALTKYPSGDRHRSAAWIRFCDACEKENKSPLKVIESLNLPK